MYTAYGMSLLVTGGRVVNGMVWEDFNIVISNQIFAFVFVFFFFFFQGGLWKAAFPVGTGGYCFEEFGFYIGVFV